MIAKVLLVSSDNADKHEEIVYEHGDANKSEAIQQAKLAHPTFHFRRVWLGEQGAHKVGQLVQTSSKFVKTICEVGGLRKLKDGKWRTQS